MSDTKSFADEMVLENLEPPSKFLFPFTPYGIQHDFMTKLYYALENKKLGIFESPTGTVRSYEYYFFLVTLQLYEHNISFILFSYQGKTLSIICGTMRWLLDHEEREQRQLKKTLEKLAKENELNNDDDDWINGQAKLLEQQRKIHEINLMMKSLEEFNNNIEQIKKVLNIFKIIFNNDKLEVLYL